MYEETRRTILPLLAITVLLSLITGSAAGFVAGRISLSLSGANGSTPFLSSATTTVKVVKEESAVIEVADKVSPAVVSIIITKDLPKIERFYLNPFGSDDFFSPFGEGFGIPFERQNGTEKREIGGGTGFIVSPDGYIITNKHVVYDKEAEYTVLMNDESRYPAKVLARDPVNDLAIIKIEGKNFPTVELGDSSNLKVGQTVIAIGNALGEFRNTVSTGVISGLFRSIVAGGGGLSEELFGVIQTDASINPGNSGGPLLNINGQVIGINTAIASGAQNIGFAIPINQAKKILADVKKYGRIVRPWLGVRYMQVTKEIAERNNLPVDYGALIVRGNNPADLAVIPGSPADKAGLQENDIILEVNGEKVDRQNPLIRAISKYRPKDKITLKVLRKGKEMSIDVVLGERK